MGMFTSIIHPVDGRELQIKCGWDMCSTYRVGDNVGQYPSPQEPGGGYLLDDVYHGWGDAFVVIKDGVVAAVVDEEPVKAEVRAARPEPSDDEDPDFVGIDECISLLRARWGVQDPPRELWSEEAWAAKAEREEQWRKEREEYEQSIAHLDGHARLAAVMGRMLKRRLDYSSIARSAIFVEPLPQGALPIYDRDPDVAGIVTGETPEGEKP
jgi:hypothetical protein